MKPERFISIRSNIARILGDCAPYLVPENQLRIELNLQLRPPATLTEFNHVIAEMELGRHIIRTTKPNEGIKVKLTELGEAEFLP